MIVDLSLNRGTEGRAESMAPSPSSFTSYTVLAFGVTSFLAGAHTLIQPSFPISAFGLPSGSEGSVRGNGLAAIAMGIYYTLAYAQQNRKFFIATVPMRLLTSFVFAFQGSAWIAPSLWEGLGALMTGFALLLDSSRKQKGD
jgi:hypothetical protein